MASRPDAMLLLLLCCLHGASLVLAECSNVTALSTALDTLLAEYDREAGPGVAAGGEGALRVWLALDVRHAAVYEPTSTVRLLADLRMSWVDRRLSWNATEWGCDSALVSAERLWLPDVSLVNAAAGGGGGAGGEQPLRARLSSDGGVAWAVRLDLAAPLAITLDAWPRDTQTAVFKFASREHTVDELDLSIKDLKYATVFESGLWEILQLSGETSSWRRSGGAQGERRLAAWTLSMRRRAPAHALAVRAVLAAAALLALAAALLPPADRAPLLACASFTATIWLVSSAGRVSAGGGGAPRVLCLMCALCVAGAAAGVGAALVRRVARLTGPPPAPLPAILSAVSAVCRLTPHQGVSEVGCGGVGAEGGGSGGGGAAWSAAAQLLDYAVLAALLLTVFIVACLAV